MGEDDDEREGQDDAQEEERVGEVMRFSRENQARVPRTRWKIMTERRKETSRRSPVLGLGLPRMRVSRRPCCHPTPCGSAICQADEYTTRDNGEVSQTLSGLSRG